jgi:hypothetical protein
MSLHKRCLVYCVRIVSWLYQDWSSTSITTVLTLDESPRLTTSKKLYMHRALVDIKEDLPDRNISRWVTITEIFCLIPSQSDWNCCHQLSYFVHNLRQTYLYRRMVSEQCPQTWTVSVINKLPQMKHSDWRINKTYSVWNRITCRLQAERGETVNISSATFTALYYTTNTVTCIYLPCHKTIQQIKHTTYLSKIYLWHTKTHSQKKM